MARVDGRMELLPGDPLATTTWPPTLIEEASDFLRSQPIEPHEDPQPPGWHPSGLRVLLPYSGSEAADHALEVMARMAHSWLCEVRVLHVREYDACRGMRFFVMPEAEAWSLTHRAVARLRRQGVAATGILRPASRADVGWAIVAEAAQSKTSVILLGSHRRHTIDLVRRNLVRQVLRRADCPVLVVCADPHAPTDHSPGERRKAA